MSSIILTESCRPVLTKISSTVSQTQTVIPKTLSQVELPCCALCGLACRVNVERRSKTGRQYARSGPKSSTLIPEHRQILKRQESYEIIINIHFDIGIPDPCRKFNQEKSYEIVRDNVFDVSDPEHWRTFKRWENVQDCPDQRFRGECPWTSTSAIERRTSSSDVSLFRRMLRQGERSTRLSRTLSSPLVWLDIVINVNKPKTYDIFTDIVIDISVPEQRSKFNNKRPTSLTWTSS